MGYGVGAPTDGGPKYEPIGIVPIGQQNGAGVYAQQALYFSGQVIHEFV